MKYVYCSIYVGLMVLSLVLMFRISFTEDLYHFIIVFLAGLLCFVLTIKTDFLLITPDSC